MGRGGLQRSFSKDDFEASLGRDPALLETASSCDPSPPPSPVRGGGGGTSVSAAPMVTTGGHEPPIALDETVEAPNSPPPAVFGTSQKPPNSPPPAVFGTTQNAPDSPLVGVPVPAQDRCSFDVAQQQTSRSFATSALRAHDIPLNIFPLDDVIECSISAADELMVLLAQPSKLAVDQKHKLWFCETVMARISLGRMTRVRGLFMKRFGLWLAVDSVHIVYPDADAPEVCFTAGLVSLHIPTSALSRARESLRHSVDSGHGRRLTEKELRLSDSADPGHERRLMESSRGMAVLESSQKHGVRPGHQRRLTELPHSSAWLHGIASPGRPVPGSPRGSPRIRNTPRKSADMRPLKGPPQFPVSHSEAEPAGRPFAHQAPHTRPFQSMWELPGSPSRPLPDSPPPSAEKARAVFEPYQNQSPPGSPPPSAGKARGCHANPGSPASTQGSSFSFLVPGSSSTAASPRFGHGNGPGKTWHNLSVPS